MMRCHRLTIVLFAAITFASVMGFLARPGLAQESSFDETDRRAIREAIETFVVLEKEGRWKEFAELYTVDAVLMPPNHETIVGRVAIQAFFEPFVVLDFEAITDEIEGHGDIAYSRGRSVWRAQVGADQLINSKGKWLMIWHRQGDGSWLVAREMWNSDLTP